MKKTLPVLLIVLAVAGFGAWWQFGAPQPFGTDTGNAGQKADLIRLATPRPGAEISSPLTITGEARGNWYFEASFPVFLTDWDGRIIAQGIAQAQGDWMTTEFVPFKATLTFAVDKNVYSKRGSLILKKDNPSGLPEHDDALEVPIMFAEPSTSAVLHAAVGQTVTALDVSLTPLAIISDSRCPIDAQCIWAGTVQVKVRIQSGLGTSEMKFEPSQPVTTEAEEVTLTEVGPVPIAGIEIPAASYRFTFKVKKR